MPGAQVLPPSVDLTIMMRRLVVVGQKPKTSPTLFERMSPPIAVPVDSAPLTWIGAASHVPPAPAVRRLTYAGLPLCQMAYVWPKYGDVALLSTQTICLSTLVCDPEGVPSNVHVAPPSVE